MDPNTSALYVASSGKNTSNQGGIWKTTNGGNNFYPLTLPPTGSMHHITSIVHHPTKRNVLFFSEEADPGVWKISYTVDAGVTWNGLSSGYPSDVPINHLEFQSNGEPSCPQYLYAATSMGVYKIDINTETTVSMAIYWNMLSAPTNACDLSKAAIFPDAASGAWTLESNVWVQKDPLVIGQGYWVRFLDEQSVTTSGLANNALSINLSAGWHLIAAPTQQIKVSQIRTSPANIVESGYYSHGTSYVHLGPDDYLIPGQGYWVKLSSIGSIILDPTASPSEPSPPGNENPPAGPNVSPLAPQGLSYTSVLTCGGGDHYPRLTWHHSPSSNLQSYQVYREDCEQGNGCAGTQIIATVSSEETTYTDCGLAIGGKFSPCSAVYWVKSIDMFGIISEDQSNQLSIQAKYCGEWKTAHNGTDENAPENIPTTTSLGENYPNPFNPTTVIKYGLAKDAHVSLQVYDVLGRVVASLVNEEQSAGYQSVEFNASNLPSGLYFYRLNAGSFTDIKKMMLVK